MTIEAGKHTATALLVAVVALALTHSAVTTAKETAKTQETTTETSTAPGTKRTDLQRHDLSAPGREVVQVRVDFDPGYVSPKHTHPGEEIIYVIEGELEYEVEGTPPARYKAGDVLFVPAGAVHWVKNVGSTNGAELATYVVEKGKPLFVPIQ